MNQNLIQFTPELAVMAGESEAIFVQQVQFLSNAPGAKRINNEKWVERTYEEWHDIFPFWSTRKISRVIKSCREKNLIKVSQLSGERYDRTNWYTVNHAELDRLEKEYDKRYEQQ